MAELLAERRISVTVEETPSGPTLTTHTCPYPSLAEQDQGICTLERMMYSELVGQDVKLTHCRLDGDKECRFHVG